MRHLLQTRRNLLIAGLTALLSLTLLSCEVIGSVGASDEVWEKRIERAIGDGSECEYTVHTPVDPTYYNGPLIDTHFHIPHMPDSSPQRGELNNPYLDVANLSDYNAVFPLLGVNISVDEIACSLRGEGTDAVFAFFPVFPNISSQALEVTQRTMDAYPELFIPFINATGKDDVPSASADALSKMLAEYPGLFDGYGEIGLYSAGRRSADDYEPDNELFQDIFTVVTNNGLAVYLHPGEGHVDNLSNAAAQFPDVNFIVHGEQVENEIIDLMAQHPNIFFTVNDLYGDQYLLHQGENTESFVAAISDTEALLEKDLALWKPQIEAFPDQFLWGTDRGGIAVWTFDIEVGRAITDYGRAFISRLDPAVQERFAYQNARRIVGRD